ncbi:MAG: EF-P lysine aminoacylase GenX [Magnetococcales bacterium]|nr:EF-P lysine aminoacylase GenX [Magnetococcales bacterium]
MSDTPLWSPSTTLETLRERAKIIGQVRRFFESRGVLEVETPLLAPAIAPEPHMEPISCGNFFLRSSPETPMKRLLAAGSGPVFQICRAFRSGESGPRHNPEFTILEWYRPGWSLGQLMGEVVDLVREITQAPSPMTFTYREAFLRFAGIDPFQASEAELAAHITSLHPPSELDRDGMLDLLLLERVEPGFAQLEAPVLLTDYPPSQAAMAEVDPGPPPVARRFELYLYGIELANGYQELTDPWEQEQRLEQANAERVRNGLAPLPLDRLFLDALNAGLPLSAGVALGLDRLVMVALGKQHIEEVIPFPWDRT